MRAALRCLVVAALIGWHVSAQAEPLSPCEQAGREAEQQFGLPPGLLVAIGRVESGRWDPVLRRVTPWPWTIDVAGEGRLFEDKDAVLAATAALRAAGAQNVDVGCFQISLLHHPDAFPTLDAAFDPAANADYAARFLTGLRARLGSWPEAVAAYHSADPERGSAYRAQVYATWTDSGEPGLAPLPSPGTGIRIWTPRRAGDAPRFLALAGVLPGRVRLPRVITPAQ